MRLEPFAIATLVLQAPDAKLPVVPITLGNLYRIFSNPDVEVDVRNAVHNSLEKRWAKADQDVFIAGLLMNPYIRGKCLGTGSSFLTPAGLYGIIKRVYGRVMRKSVELDLYQAFRDYMANVNEFSPEEMMLDDMKAMYTQAGKQVDLVDVWCGIDNQKTTGRNTLVKFAIHILSVVVNSAACERIFSRFGITHTKRRSRLCLEKVRKTAVVKMDLQRAHIEAGLIRGRAKRKFGAAFEQDSSSTTAMDPPVSSIPATAEDHEELEDDVNESGEDIRDFEALAEELISAAECDEVDGDGDDDRCEVSATADAAASPMRSGITIRIPPRKTSIPLKDLFIYPEDPSAPSDLEFYWKCGITKLEETTAAYEILSEPGSSSNDT